MRSFRLTKWLSVIMCLVLAACFPIVPGAGRNAAKAENGEKHWYTFSVLPWGIVSSTNVDYLALDARVLPPSYVYSFVITLLFAAFTNLVMRSKLEKVDMACSFVRVSHCLIPTPNPTRETLCLLPAIRYSRFPTRPLRNWRS